MDGYDIISRTFPAIKSGFSITSPRDNSYNCIAWAAGDSSNWWWPSKDTFWPIPNVTEPTVAAFLSAFETIGFKRCTSAKFELGVCKLAIYVGGDGMVTHMARQLPDGAWTSKLGPSWDIRHVSPECLNGDSYGTFAFLVGRSDVGESLVAKIIRIIKGTLRIGSRDGGGSN